MSCCPNGGINDAESAKVYWQCHQVSVSVAKGTLTSKEDRNFRRMVASSGLNKSPIPGMVLERYVHLLIRPWVKAA